MAEGYATVSGEGGGERSGKQEGRESTRDIARSGHARGDERRHHCDSDATARAGKP